MLYYFHIIICSYSYVETHFLPRQFLILTDPIRLQEMIHPCNLLSLVASMQGRFGGFLCLPNGYLEGESHPPDTFKNILVCHYLLHCSRIMILILGGYGSDTYLIDCNVISLRCGYVLRMIDHLGHS